MVDDFSWTGYSASAPTVTTGTAGTPTTNSVTISGNVIDNDGGAAISERGVVYATTQTPTLANSVVVADATSPFAATLTGLAANTTYYVRAYATNSVGTSYGSQIDFTTDAASGLIGVTGDFSAFTSTYGTASTAQTVSVSASDVTGNLTVTAPTGFEVSLEANNNYGATAEIAHSGGTISSTTVYVRVAAATTPGSYDGNVSFAANGAETVNEAIPSSTVGAKALTLADAAVTTKTYDGTNTATITGTLTGVINDDAVGFTVTGEFANVNAGTGISVTANVSLTGADAANYSIVQPLDLTGTIDEKPVTVTAEAKSKVAGAGDPTFTYTVDPALIGSDVFTGSLSRAAGELPGTYAITIGTLANANYDVTFVSANLTINPQAPTATAASSVTATGFTANWNAVDGATGYRVDVYRQETTYATDLFFSEYIEGSSNHKYIEIYNGTGVSVDLSDYEIRLHANGAVTPSSTQILSGILANGEAYVLRNSSASIPGTTGFASSAVANFNGNDALSLFNKNTVTTIDYFGSVGHDPGTSWTESGNTTIDKTLRRKSSVTSGLTVNPATGFPTLGTEWDQFDMNDVSGLGTHTSDAGSTETTYLSGFNNADAGTGTSFAVTGATSGTAYKYVVRAQTDALTSANSNEIDVTTLGVYTVDIPATAGWRMMSLPVSTSLASFLAPGWTQGMGGSDAPDNGEANVRAYGAGTFVQYATLEGDHPAGDGFIYYHFNDDDYDGNINTNPTTFSVTGAEHASPVTVSLPNSNWYIAGNPFASTIDWDLVAKNGAVSTTVYVYDPAYTTLGDLLDEDGGASVTGNYRAWNGTAGSLTDGKIAPFQGFWVQTTGSGAWLTIESDDKVTGGTFLGKEMAPMVFSVGLKGEGMQSEAFVQFGESASAGFDGMDAYKLTPLVMPTEHYALLYTRLDDGTALDINHLPVPTAAIEIPLGLDHTRGSRFELFLSSNHLPEGWMVSVRDAVTGHTTALDPGTRLAISSDSPLAKRGPTVTPEGPAKVQASSPRFTLIVEPVGTTSVDSGQPTADSFKLNAAYPNPFNPTTVIGYRLSVFGQTRLAVYDLLGREVAVLVDGVLPAGAHSVNFDASGLSSGIYLVRLESGGRVATQRVTLLK